MLLPLLHQHRKLLTCKMEPLVHPKLLQQPMKQLKKTSSFPKKYLLTELHASTFGIK